MDKNKENIFESKEIIFIKMKNQKAFKKEINIFKVMIMNHCFFAKFKT